MKMAALVPARVKLTDGMKSAIARIPPWFASKRSVFSASKSLKDRDSRVNSWRIAIPLMFSLR